MFENKPDEHFPQNLESPGQKTCLEKLGSFRSEAKIGQTVQTGLVRLISWNYCGGQCLDSHVIDGSLLNLNTFVIVRQNMVRNVSTN